jgi:hypothetical protein
MITLSESAKKSLEDYLRQARAYLRGSKSVDSDEVEQNITEHIENELEGAAEPVSHDVLEAVLKKLGKPQQWVPEEELSWWRKIILRLRSGPEDWRLSYLSFTLIVAGLLLSPNVPVGIILILAGFIAARAVLSVTVNDKELKAQRWLIFPSLILVYIPLLLFIMCWPLILINIWWFPKYHGLLMEIQAAETTHTITLAEANVGAIGLWWTAFGATLLIQRTRIRACIVFRPFLDKFNRKHAVLLVCVGVVLLVLSVGTSLLHYQGFI